MTTPLELLYQALAAPIGIACNVNDVQACRQALYRARAKSGTAELQRLQIRVNPLRPSESLWIIKSAGGSATGE
jgi:hypothetical protein